MENDKKTKLAELKAQMAAETEQALKAHEKDIGVLIGKLQVGAARRQDLIKKQDDMLKELEVRKTF